MKIIKSIFILIGIIIVILGGLVAFVVVSDYVPEEIEDSEYTIRNDEQLNSELTLAIFNIGYCGLDQGQDFFMDGGTGSRSSSEEQTRINLEKNIKTMEKINADVYLLQEVDIDSTRSFNINEKEMIVDTFSDYSFSFVHNYLVPWVPIPLSLPMGKAESGLLTLVRGEISEATRYDLPKEEKIPDKYFLLDRCINETVVPINGDEELHIINLHLSAYDSAGVIKKIQMAWLREFILERDLSKDYYIFGGDWNQLLSEDIIIDRDQYNPEWLGSPPHDFDDLPVQWGYDIRTNTVRDLYETYHPGSTFETVIDGFLVSDNIEILDVKTVDAGFENSDHNPVTMTIKIKQ